MARASRFHRSSSYSLIHIYPRQCHIDECYNVAENHDNLLTKGDSVGQHEAISSTDVKHRTHRRNEITHHCDFSTFVYVHPVPSIIQTLFLTEFRSVKVQQVVLHMNATDEMQLIVVVIEVDQMNPFIIFAGQQRLYRLVNHVENVGANLQVDKAYLLSFPSR